MKKTFAIVIVCYNRVDGVKRLTQSLERVNFDGRKDIDLIFSIDNSGLDIVERFATNYQWGNGKKIIRTFEKRQGLKRHILKCGEYTNEYDILVVLEDDIFVSDSMYYYAYNAAVCYWDDTSVAGISLYSFQKNWLKWLARFEPQKTKYDTYFMKIAMSWGQVWTKPQWESFEAWIHKNEVFEKADDLPDVLNIWPETSWLKYHDLYCIRENKYFVYPYVSISTNYSDVGEHAQYAVTDHQVELMYGKKEYLFALNDDSAVRYDEFMEREGLGKYIGIEDSELTIDLWGNKPKKYYKKYVLTIENLPYEQIETYALSLRPIELSVILKQEGNEIKLYDTSKESLKKKNINADFYRYRYSIRSNDYLTLLKFSLMLSGQLFSDIKIKIYKMIRKLV